MWATKIQASAEATDASQSLSSRRVSVRGGGGDSSLGGGVAGVAIEGAGYGGVADFNHRVTSVKMVENSG
jgi:hypothetical protein